MKGQIQGYSDFEALYLCKDAELGHKLQFNINRKAYMGSPVTLSHQGHTDIKGLYLVKQLSYAIYVTIKHQ